MAAVAICGALGLLTAACSGSGGSSSASGAAAASTPRARRRPAPRLSITPANGSSDVQPGQGITVTAAHGKLSNVTVTTAGDQVTGTMNAAGTVWHSTWALDVSQRLHGHREGGTGSGQDGHADVARSGR